MIVRSVARPAMSRAGDRAIVAGSVQLKLTCSQRFSSPHLAHPEMKLVVLRIREQCTEQRSWKVACGGQSGGRVRIDSFDVDHTDTEVAASALHGSCKRSHYSLQIT